MHRHHFADNGPYGQSYGFSSSYVCIRAVCMWIVMYVCESWITKKAEDWRIDTFKLLCWRRHLRVPWTTGRSNQSILKEVNSEHSLQGLMLEAPILWPPDAKSRVTGKDPDAGKDWGQEEKWVTGDERTGWLWLNGHEFEHTPGDTEGQGSPAFAVHGVTKIWTWLSDWTTKPPTTPIIIFIIFHFHCQNHSLFSIFFFLPWIHENEPLIYFPVWRHILPFEFSTL